MSLLPNLSWRFTRVWRRNLVVYRRIWQINFLVPLLEPLFYLAAFGLGFSGLIGNVPYAGGTLTYVQFIAPALVATAIMWNAFLETTYASFVRMFYQKTFDGMLATPLSLEEIILAEIAWGATKSAGAAAIMLLVLAPFGYAGLPGGLLAVPLAFLGGIAFGAAGMIFTGLVPSIDMFNLPVFLFVTPMFLFSGTFFPISGLPGWAQTASLAFPLYHLVELTRLVLTGQSEVAPLGSLAYLTVLSAALLPLALRIMRRRIVK